jgi:hypothetical protein
MIINELMALQQKWNLRLNKLKSEILTKEKQQEIKLGVLPASMPGAVISVTADQPDAEDDDESEDDDEDESESDNEVILLY